MSKRLVRLWEILPGLLSWLTIILMIYWAITRPRLLATVVLVYAIYWLIKIFIITGHLIVGFHHYRRDKVVDWQKKLQQAYPEQLAAYYQVAIVPTYKEDISILRRTLDAIKDSRYPLKQLVVVMAFEARDPRAEEYRQIITREYEHTFGRLLTAVHPADIAGEVKGKGPNITWAGRAVKAYFDQQKISPDKVIVTTLDADNRVDPYYFANLLWTYLRTPDPIHKSFQPLPMFFNNIWQVPLPVKVTALGSSFWQIIQAMRPHYSRNFSAHAQSLAALIETDFWSVRTIVEDGHQFWRAYFVFDGNHYVTPLFVPIYMDAVEGENLYDTFREQYLQRRRWFWGVSDIPFVFERAYGNNRIPFLTKWLQFARLVESHYSLATQSFILLIGWWPAVLNPEFHQSVIGYSFPTVYRTFLGAAWVGMITSMTIASMLVPRRPGPKANYYLAMAKEWVLAPILLPLTGMIFSAIPAIDSQTRLMINKPFTVFNVTKKAALPSGVLRVSEN